MPVQHVNRPKASFRGYCGTVVAGQLRAGQRVRIMPSGMETRVREIFLGAQSRTECGTGDAVTLTLADEVDVSQGDIIAAAENPPQAADQFEAHLIWMGEQPLLPGRAYLMKLHTREISAVVTDITLSEKTICPLKIILNEIKYLCNF
jgi:bifunctional enzyme CysN/CysC